MPSHRTTLVVRMLTTTIAMVLVAAIFLAGIWGSLYLILVSVGFDGVGVATIVTSGLIIVVGYLEYQQLETIERIADADIVTESDAGELYQLTTKVATQLNIPAPTIAISNRDTPEALAVGFRPQNIHLVLSTGLIDALSPEELEAVIAHELAHVKNQDAMVMTVLSLPVMIAAGLRHRLQSIEDPGWFVVVIVPLLFVSSGVWFVGKTITARLSRAREQAADRTAAAVSGSPATLASALRTLDTEIHNTPDRDLREVSGISSLSILPLEPYEPQKIMLGPEGDVEPAYWQLRKRLFYLERRFFGTHPPTESRVETLTRMERQQQ